MISRFKFLTDNDEEDLDLPVFDIEPNFASWMWAGPSYDRHTWDERELEVPSIRSFLSNFPEQMIVPILSITGDGITMTIENDRDPWQFNILGGTTLRIVYLA